MQNMNIDILGITETKMKDKGLKQLTEHYWIYWSRVESSQWAAGGIGLIVHKKYIAQMENIKYINERILSIDWKIEHNNEYTLIVTYGPNEGDEKENLDKYYSELQEAIDDTKKNIIIMGDLNGRIGNSNTGLERIMGREGEKTLNNNGRRIIEICNENDLIITNTYFTHRDIHKYTREQPTKKEKSIIDYFITSENLRTQIKDVRVYREPDIGSDHYMLVMKFNSMAQGRKEIKRKII